jgi:hypothetical protein
MRPTAKASSSACPFPHKCLLDLFKLTNRVFVFDTRCSHTPPNSLEECLVHIKLKFSLAETRPRPQWLAPVVLRPPAARSRSRPGAVPLTGFFQSARWPSCSARLTSRFSTSI